MSATPATHTPAAGADVTPIGVDVGTTDLATVAAAEAGPAGAVSVDGSPVRELYQEFTRATHRLADRDECLGDVVARYWPRFRDEFRRAADTVIHYARRWPRPLVALEAFDRDPHPLVSCAYGNMKPSHWTPPAVHRVVADRVVAAGLPVAFVDRYGTTQECHRCGRVGTTDFGEVVCAAPECPVYAVDRDASAAVTIAKRAGGGQGV